MAAAFLPRLLVVDADATLREALGFALEGRFELFESESLELGLVLAKRLRPRLVLVDARIGGEGLWTLRGFLQMRPHAPKVVVFSTLLDLAQAQQALSLGARAVLPKPCPIDLLRSCLRLVAEESPPGFPVFSEEEAQRLA